jgi:drug/metabolite transporter (DMT)-like permease
MLQYCAISLGLVGLDWIFVASFHQSLKSNWCLNYRTLLVTLKGILLLLLSAFCSADLNLFSKNMNTVVEKFPVMQSSATIMHVYCAV